MNEKQSLINRRPPADDDMTVDGLSAKARAKRFVLKLCSSALYFLIGRKSLQLGEAATIAGNTYNPIAGGISMQTLNLISSIITPARLVLYGIQTALSTIATAIRLNDIWARKGKWADHAKSMFQRVKTTVYAVANNASDISVFIYSILLVAGVVPFTSPLTAVLLAINGGINLVKYGHSIVRTLSALSKADTPEARKPLMAKLKHTLAKMGLSSMLAIGLVAVIVVPLFLAQPWGSIIAAAIFVTWGVSNLIYKKYREHKGEIEMAPAGKSKTPEAQSVPNERASGVKNLRGLDSTTFAKSSHSSTIRAEQNNPRQPGFFHRPDAGVLENGGGGASTGRTPQSETQFQMDL